MKKNTQKLLVALYSDVSQIKNRVPVPHLQMLVPELSGGGFRSLLFALKKQGVITTQKALGVTTVSITHHGSIHLESEFPALSQKWDKWQGNWDCLVFMESPSLDKQFRFLRNLLLSEGAVAINRGVYLSPGGFSDVVLKECQNTYHSNVLLFSVEAWKLATDASFMIEKYGLLDVAEALSGISSDVDRLLKKVVDRKRLTQSDKISIHLVYDRVLDILLEDPGFCTFYFKEVESMKVSLLKLNSLISL
ncbi:hypothetical protein KA017_02450 [Candidatus Woesebacteria bacterium]|nr:hypothetical protein [Candidatus Woesebacteria bacterium]